MCNVKLRCPKYESGECLFGLCDGFLQSPVQSGYDSSCRPLYNGVCMTGGNWEHFRNLLPFAEASNVATPSPSPDEKENSGEGEIIRTKKRPKRGRIGSGLHGRKTERMDEQLTEFRNFIKDHPVHSSDKSRTLGARASQFWNSDAKQMKNDSEKTGEHKGFKSPKSLANAYRNSK